MQNKYAKMQKVLNFFNKDIDILLYYCIIIKCEQNVIEVRYPRVAPPRVRKRPGRKGMPPKSSVRFRAAVSGTRENISCTVTLVLCRKGWRAVGHNRDLNVAGSV